MTYVDKHSVKKDLDLYIDIIDIATEALELLEKKNELQEQIEQGYEAEEDQVEIESITLQIAALKKRWVESAESCGRTNAKDSIHTPLNGTHNLDYNSTADLRHEIDKAKEDVVLLEKTFEISAKAYKK